MLPFINYRMLLLCQNYSLFLPYSVLNVTFNMKSFLQQISCYVVLLSYVTQPQDSYSSIAFVTGLVFRKIQTSFIRFSLILIWVEIEY